MWHCRAPPSIGRSRTVAHPIEERAESEVTEISGAFPTAASPASACRRWQRAANPAFDVTPARLVTGLITERGVAAASREGLLALFPERRSRLAGE